MDNIFPVSNKSKANYSSTKVVFSNPQKKKEVYAAKKRLFRNHIRDVYVNEDLTSKNFNLLMLARRKKREGQSRLEFV